MTWFGYETTLAGACVGTLISMCGTVLEAGFWLEEVGVLNDRPWSSYLGTFPVLSVFLDQLSCEQVASHSCSLPSCLPSHDDYSLKPWAQTKLYSLKSGIWFQGWDRAQMHIYNTAILLINQILLDLKPPWTPPDHSILRQLPHWRGEEGASHVE